MPDTNKPNVRKDDNTKTNVDKKQRTGQGASHGKGVNEPERGDQTLHEDENRPEDSTTQNERKTNPGQGFTTDTVINPEQGATKSW